jgi:hypothetical protein
MFPIVLIFVLNLKKKRIRLYGEVQTGIGVAGISAGPVIEIQTDTPSIKLGYQASIWGNYYLGFDFRYRRIGKKSFYCPGTYLKIPFNGLDENGEKVDGSNSNGDSFDFD